MGTAELESATYWLSWIKWMEYFSAFLVVVGVAGELLGSLLAGRFEETIEKARQLEIAALTKEAADARLETAKIREKLAWRELSAEQQTRIVEKLKQFAGTEYEVRVFRDPESLNLLHTIVEVLHIAGWKQGSPSGFLDIPTKYGPVTGSLSSGIHVRNDSSREDFEAPAIMFADALVNEGIVALAHKTNVRPNEPHTERVQIEIGKKP